MNNQPTALPRALTKEQIALLARHAAERAELDGRHHNERVEQMERHRAEAIALGPSAAPGAPT